LKPIKNKNGEYYLKATKLWDMSSPVIGTIGSYADALTNFAGG
jgi:hypothetical protein